MGGGYCTTARDDCRGRSWGLMGCDAEISRPAVCYLLCKLSEGRLIPLRETWTHLPTRRTGHLCICLYDLQVSLWGGLVVQGKVAGSNPTIKGHFNVSPEPGKNHELQMCQIKWRSLKGLKVVELWRTFLIKTKNAFVWSVATFASNSDSTIHNTIFKMNSFVSYTRLHVCWNVTY